MKVRLHNNYVDNEGSKNMARHKGSKNHVMEDDEAELLATEKLCLKLSRITIVKPLAYYSGNATNLTTDLIKMLMNFHINEATEPITTAE